MSTRLALLSYDLSYDGFHDYGEDGMMHRFFATDGEKKRGGK